MGAEGALIVEVPETQEGRYPRVRQNLFATGETLWGPGVNDPDRSFRGSELCHQICGSRRVALIVERDELIGRIVAAQAGVQDVHAQIGALERVLAPPRICSRHRT